MKIEVVRTIRTESFTEGKMYIDGVYICDTLEDIDRLLNSKMTPEKIATVKEKGMTAIPIGVYKLILNRSRRFKIVLPLLINVLGFAGIRIHAGNTTSDTEGCILVGTRSEQGKLKNSKSALYVVMKLIMEALIGKSQISLTITYQNAVKQVTS